MFQDLTLDADSKVPIPLPRGPARFKNSNDQSLGYYLPNDSLAELVADIAFERIKNKLADEYANLKYKAQFEDSSKTRSTHDSGMQFTRQFRVFHLYDPRFLFNFWYCFRLDITLRGESPPLWPSARISDVVTYDSWLQPTQVAYYQKLKEGADSDQLRGYERHIESLIKDEVDYVFR